MPPKNDHKADQDSKQDETSLRFACLQLAAQLYGQQINLPALLEVTSAMHKFVATGEVPEVEEAPDDLDFNDANTDLDDASLPADGSDAAGEQG